MLCLRILFFCALFEVFWQDDLRAQLSSWQELRVPKELSGDDNFDNKSLQQLPLEVITLCNPSFGSFYCGSGGGSITIESDGTRNVEGDVILMSSNYTCSPAVFEVRCQPYTMLQLFRDEEFFITDNDGQILRFSIVSTNPAFPSVTPPNSAQGFTVTASVRLNLEPGQLLSPGAFVGVFHITWINE